MLSITFSFPEETRFKLESHPSMRTSTSIEKLSLRKLFSDNKSTPNTKPKLRNSMPPLKPLTRPSPSSKPSLTHNPHYSKSRNSNKPSTKSVRRHGREWNKDLWFRLCWPWPPTKTSPIKESSVRSFRLLWNSETKWLIALTNWPDKKPKTKLTLRRESTN